MVTFFRRILSPDLFVHSQILIRSVTQNLQKDRYATAYEAPEEPDVFSVLKQAIDGEQCAIQVYSNLAEATQGKDIVTYELASRILADEVEHEEDLQALFEDIEGMAKRYGG